MYLNHSGLSPTLRPQSRLMAYLISGLMAVALLAIFICPANAQQLTGTLSGTVFDQTGAVVVGAKVELKNEASGDLRGAVSDKVGFFSITAVQPGSYTITISAEGFAPWQEPSIAMGQGDTRSVANIKLRVGGKTAEVEVVSGADAVVPVDTGEISTTLNTEMVNDIVIGGRDAGELMKIMPGFALNNGLTQGSGFNSKVVGSNTGPVGDYSSNGTQPNGTMAYMLDGADLVDPGNFGTQIANINQDMVAEVKVLTSSYTAEYAKGPVLFEAFSKSGGSHFHGEGYTYARNSALNSWDWYAKNQYISNSASNPSQASVLAASLHPDEHYYYMGGNVGGPLVIPFLNFNKKHDKLFFWGGYEYMNQHPAATPVLFNVPTNAQMGGDFSNADLSPTVLAGVQGNGTVQYAYYNANGNIPTNGSTNHIPVADFDPHLKGLIAEGAYPKENVTPNNNNGWNNYEYVSAIPQNRWEATGKINYSFSENTKLTGSYTRQDETDQHPLSIWWAAPWTLPYPSPVVADTVGNFIMSNFTHVFNPTTTNEFVFTYARWINPSTLQNPAAVDRTALSFNVPTVFNHGHPVSQIPNVEGPWGGTIPNISEEAFDGGFDGGKGFGGTKLAYGLYDNFTKIVGSHTLKGGFYWDFAGDTQSSSSGDNGTYNLGWGQNGTGNVVADLLLGRIGNYQEQSSIPVYQIGFHQWSLYAQDAWKVNKQLTLNYGVRADHEGQWYGGVASGNFWWGGGGVNDLGFQVWNPATYVNSPSAPGNTGLAWNAIDPSVPLSGFTSKFLQFSPRVGFAYDITGNGRTVFRGGYAVFQYQVTSQVGSAWGGPQDSFGITDNGPNGSLNAQNMDLGYGGISTYKPQSSTVQNGSSVYGLELGDNRNPYTTDWNVTLSQALPWRSVFEVSYVGNKSANLYQDGSNGNIGNLNNQTPGSTWLPDPYPTSAYKGMIMSPDPPSCSSTNTSFYCQNLTNPNATYGTASGSITSQQGSKGWDFAPLQAYQNVYLLAHTGYSNYNSAQISWQKQSGPVTFLTNYTFSKVLGIWDYVTSNGAGSGPNVDTFNLKNNYGPLAFDHTQILNLAYIWNMPKFIHDGNKILLEAVNGWQFSGYTAFQSGAPLQSNLNGNLNASFPTNLSVPTVQEPTLPDNSILLPNGLRSTAVDTETWFGTDSQRVLLPQITCDPRKGLTKGQYFNPNCFTIPAYGQQGTLTWPYMRGPAYFDSDLALFKNFKITENQKIQFRLQAQNFLNHPLRQFGVAGNSDESLNFTQTISELDPANPSSGNTINKIYQSPTNTNASTTGIPALKVGSRSLLISAKYYF